jgi:hypothetical protein
MTMRLLLPLLLLSWALPAAAGIRTDFDPEARFEGRTTFGWKASEGQAKFAEEEPFLDKYLRAALRAELVAKGMRETDESADLLLSYRAAVKQRLEVTEDPDWFPRRSWCDDDLTVRSYDEVTYTVDAWDGAKGELMWRGWASEPQAADGRTQRQVERLVKKLMKRYPPR